MAEIEEELQDFKQIYTGNYIIEIIIEIPIRVGLACTYLPQPAKHLEVITEISIIVGFTCTALPQPAEHLGVITSLTKT